MSEDFLVRGGLRAGALVAGYRVGSRIGAGGMAVVYRARDERLGRWVALKVIAPEWAHDEEFRRRFVAESLAAARVDDPHVIPVYEAGRAGGVLFIAMRLVTGADLQGVLRREGALPPGRALGLLSPVASALDAAHAAGLVHRDVKPGNVLVDERPGRPDHVYLADFGLSKGAVAGVSLAGGSLVGTPGYSAPEQVRGSDVDGRADQYALGCVAFELLAGQAPFERDQPLAVLLAHLWARPPSLTAVRPGLPPAADAVIARALAKRPEQRYGSCREFTDALRAAFGLPPYHCGGVARGRAGPGPEPGAGAATKADPRRRPGPTGPSGKPRRQALAVALTGAVLAAAAAVAAVAAVPWMLASSPGTPAATITAKTEPATPSRPFATFLAPVNSAGVVSAAFKPGTATLAVSMGDNDVYLRDTTTRTITGVLHPNGGGPVAFGPGGTLAVGAGVGAGGDVYLWDTARTSPVLTATLPVPTAVSGQSVTSMAFGPGGVLAVAYEEGNIYLWDIATKKITATLTGPPGIFGTTVVAFGPGGVLAAGYGEGSVSLWHITPDRHIATLPDLPGTDGVDSVAFDPAGATLAVGYDNGDVSLWDTATRRTSAIIAPPADTHIGFLGSNGSQVAFGPGGTLAVGGFGNVYLWRIES